MWLACVFIILYFLFYFIVYSFSHKKRLALKQFAMFHHQQLLISVDCISSFYHFLLCLMDSGVVLFSNMLPLGAAGYTMQPV